MDILEECARFTANFEGCKLQSYQDSVGVWTIGYGHTSQVKDNMSITSDEAIDFLKQDIKFALNAVYHYINIPLNPNQIIALTDFVYNLGAYTLQHSTLRMKINRNELKQTASEFLKYNKAGGKILKGLALRRQAEANLFNL